MAIVKRFGQRAALIYLALFFFPVPSGLSDPGFLSSIFDPVWHAFIPFVAKRLFHIDITVFSGGSGDTTYDYLRIASMAVFAVVSSAVWTAIVWARPMSPRLREWARVWLRYALAFSMLTYGVVKVIKLQFPPPSYVALTG